MGAEHEQARADAGPDAGTASQHEVLRVLAERAGAAGQHADGRRIALAIEGGGMRGTISGGMALALHELGLVTAFDALYGSSAGAISGAWLLSSRPAGLRGWTEPAFARTLIRRYGPLRGRPVADVRALVEEVYQTVFPLDFASVLASPVEYHPLATDAASGHSTDLRPLIGNPAELRLAMRASAAMPLLAGHPVKLGGRRFYDAGVSESVPYRTAIAQGATHVLVLRSRSEPLSDAGPSRSSAIVVRTALRRESVALRATFLARDERLADDDARLDRYDAHGIPGGQGIPGQGIPGGQGASSAGGPWVLSIRPAADSPYVSRLATGGPLLLAAFEAGRAAVHAAFAGVLAVP
jgi:predicted patatin/cPLA2 family phospholipase